MTDIIEPGPQDIRAPNGRYAKGAPGRPKGAKGKALTIIKDTIEKAFMKDAANGTGTRLERAIDQQVTNAENGDLAALLALMQYWAGRPRQIQKDEDKDIDDSIKKLAQLIRGDNNGDFRPQADMVGKKGDDNDD